MILGSVAFSIGRGGGSGSGSSTRRFGAGGMLRNAFAALNGCHCVG